jgi:hypothetical protein
MRLFNLLSRNDRRSRQEAAPNHRQRRQVVEHREGGGGGGTAILPSDHVPLERRGAPPASDQAISDLIHLRHEVSIPQERNTSRMECLVCTQDYQEGAIAAALPCGHIFHAECAVEWLCRHCTCPTCRFELPTANLRYEEQRKQRMKERRLAQDKGASQLDFWELAIL